jgi:ketosteroid isomerase-like protein
MKTLSRDEMLKALATWQRSWNEHDLDGVLDLMHDNVVFEHWTGAEIRSKELLRRAWSPWFSDHGGFCFVEEGTFVDEVAQKAVYRWMLVWPSAHEGHEGRVERRGGVDVLHFEDGKIVRKLTYSKTTVEVDGESIRLKGKVHSSAARGARCRHESTVS